MIEKLEFGTIVMDGEAFNRPDKVEFTDGPWRTALTGMGADIEFRISFLKSGKMMTEEFLIARGAQTLPLARVFRQYMELNRSPGLTRVAPPTGERARGCVQICT